MPATPPARTTSRAWKRPPTVVQAAHGQMDVYRVAAPGADVAGTVLPLIRDADVTSHATKMSTQLRCL